MIQGREEGYFLFDEQLKKRGDIFFKLGNECRLF